MKNERANWTKSVRIPSGKVVLDGELIIPPAAHGLVLFAHGSRSSRHSPRNQYVAEVIRAAGIATLLFDLLTAEEEGVDVRTLHLRFDIDLLARRLQANAPTAKVSVRHTTSTSAMAAMC